MRPLEVTYEAKQRIWTKLSQSECDFVIFLTTCRLHTVEACVAVSLRETIDEFEYFVLKAVDILVCADVESVNSLLHIGRQIILQIVAKMEKDNLLSITDDGVFGITDMGKESLKSGVLIKLQRKRQIFHFIDQSNEFVKINNRSSGFLVDLEPNDTASDWNFDIKSLQSCIDRADDWKKQHLFSLDVQELIMPCRRDSGYGELVRQETLIIDKAQSVNCAMLVKFKKNKPFELFAYPISRKGYLLDKDCLFSLMGEDVILETFPYVTGTPEEKQLNAAFKLLGERYSLDEIVDISIKSCRNHTVIKASNDTDINWVKFYWQHAQGNIFYDTTSSAMTRMNKLMIESNNQQAVNLLYEINESHLSGNHLKDMSTYKGWLSDKEHLPEVPIRNLASLAWNLGNYRLAYSLAEVEDMVDAKI